MIPQNEHWTREITQVYGNRANITSRYATKKEPWVFDKKRLAQIISSLPGGYTLRMIDEPLFHMCRAEYRRRGLASICGAKLILECLNRNLYPSWDAQNEASAALAEKLGYHYSHTYTAIEIFR